MSRYNEKLEGRICCFKGVQNNHQLNVNSKSAVIYYINKKIRKDIFIDLEVCMCSRDPGHSGNAIGSFGLSS